MKLARLLAPVLVLGSVLGFAVLPANASTPPVTCAYSISPLVIHSTDTITAKMICHNWPTTYAPALASVSLSGFAITVGGTVYSSCIPGEAGAPPDGCPETSIYFTTPASGGTATASVSGGVLTMATTSGADYDSFPDGVVSGSDVWNVTNAHVMTEHPGGWAFDTASGGPDPSWPSSGQMLTASDAGFVGSADPATWSGFGGSGATTPPSGSDVTGADTIRTQLIDWTESHGAPLVSGLLVIGLVFGLLLRYSRRGAGTA